MAEVDLRYPIGKMDEQPFSKKEYDEELKKSLLNDIKITPALLENAITNLDEKQLNTPYRTDGWNIKQVVHHVADSHMNAYMRFKLGLTENEPTIKTYDEGAWSELNDTTNLPVNISLTLLHALHIRWVELMKNMSEEDWQRTIFHPEHQKKISLWYLLKMYAWHGKHHVAHITSLRERMGW